MSRADLARQQAALVEALVCGGAQPPGFDPVRLRATADVLLHKRAAAAAGHWPLLAVSLGPQWPATFGAWAAGRVPVGGWRDGWDLARHLAALGQLGDLHRVNWPPARQRGVTTAARPPGGGHGRAGGGGTSIYTCPAVRDRAIGLRTGRP